MDRWAVRGGSVRLRCIHDVPTHLLDKVVFLRQGTKIFQYIRNRKPPYRNFTTPGAVLNVALATENSIVLQNLDFAASGGYTCEVTLDTPIFTKASVEKHLTVFHPQKHNPRIEFPTRFLSSGEILRANCTTAPASPAPHVTWFINGKKMSAAQSYEEPHVVTSRHRNRRPNRGHDLYVTVSELRLEATGRLDIVCVSTIPEFRSIDDKFADLRNDTVIVEVIKPSPLTLGPANLTTTEPSPSSATAFHPHVLIFTSSLVTIHRYAILAASNIISVCNTFTCKTTKMFRPA